MPLIHIVESDDLHLERRQDILWFNLLRNFRRHPSRSIAARCYEALQQFVATSKLGHRKVWTRRPPGEGA